MHCKKKEIISIGEPVTPNPEKPDCYIEIQFDIGEPYLKTFSEKQIALNYKAFYEPKIRKTK